MRLSLLCSLLLTFCSFTIIEAPVTSAPEKTYDIIFDLGLVLIAPDKLSISYCIGWQHFLVYALYDMQNPLSLQEKAFDFLETAFGKQKSSDGLYALYSNRPLPQIMCDWLAGIVTGPEVVRLTKKKLKEPFIIKAFASSRERLLIQRIIETMFDPHILAKHTFVKKEGLRLVEQLAQQGHRLYILSNFDTLTFSLLSQHEDMKKLLSYFDPRHVVISGSVGTIKPHHAIYQYLIERGDITPSNALFIDDQWENIRSSEQLGMHGIHLVNENYEAVTAELKKLGAL